MRAWFHQMLLRWESLGKRRQLDRDLDDELVFHLAKREEDNRAAGMDATEARYAARRTLGNTTRQKEISRELWSFASCAADDFSQTPTIRARLA